MPNSEALAKPAKSKPALGPEIDLFIKQIDSIGDVLHGLTFALGSVHKASTEKLKEFQEENCKIEQEDNGKWVVRIPGEHVREWRRLRRRSEHFELSRSLLPRSLLVSMVSQYDAYLGRLLRSILLSKPEILNSSEREISFELLNQFSSLEAVREHIIEKEVEGVLRSSHAEQFKWMEVRFKVELTKGLDSWPVFIELTERRNLFVHTDGVVSSQYLAVCRLHKCGIEQSIAEGSRLGVSKIYFEAARRCIYELGTKLGHVLWRKLFPDEREEADGSFAAMTYDLIDNGEYELAIRLLDFGCEYFKQFSSELSKLTLVVNRAQAYKWKGDEKRCHEIMASVDWSAKEDKFKLADAVLSRDWARAVALMKRMGSGDSGVNKVGYRDWPLFREFRKEAAFLSAYEEIFGETFVERAEVEKQEGESLPGPAKRVAALPTLSGG